jgi:mannose-1-phosphate guanylyltransferase
MLDSLHVVVVAGGSGTRFWPLSRKSRPKQLLDLDGRGPLLSQTFSRVRSLAPPSAWWMVVGSAYAQACRDCVPEIPTGQVLVEPFGRNTAPAIGLAAAHLERLFPDALFVALASDHHIRDDAAWAQALKCAAAVAEKGGIATVGLNPTHAETGYGYIQRGDADKDVNGAYRVVRFCEKPDRARAEEFLRSGDYLWNASVFVMRPATFFAELSRQKPLMARAFKRVQSAIGTREYETVLREVYSQLESISIDYAVMEHAQQVTVVPVQCGWSDVGSWAALGAVRERDGDGNVKAGHIVAMDSRDCVLYASSDHVVAVVGMSGVVVAHTPDATLVLPASRAQDVRSIVEQLERQGWKAFL